MPADLPHTERLLLSTSRGARGLPGPGDTEERAVLHEFSTRVRIAAEHAEGQAVAPPVEIDLDAMPPDLDPTERFGLAGFAERISEGFAAAKDRRPLAGEAWDGTIALSPDPSGVAMQEALGMAPPRPPAPLRGRIAVGLLLVSGPQPELQLDEDAQVKAVAEVQQGLSWLGTAAPAAGITWAYDIRPIELDVPAEPALVGFEALEALWRDPALAQMGYPTGFAGIDAYVNGLVSEVNAASGFCALITRYPTGHFAYATIGGPRIVQQYENGSWGIDNIDQVFAHETCHIFGAPDEYKVAGCDCGGSWGTSRAPNSNCITCADGGGTECIMRSNAKVMCSATVGHLGW